MDLTVRIPKRYKNTLSKRFNPKYAKYEDDFGLWHIHIRCPLCSLHQKNDNRCGNCPFKKFNNSAQTGCSRWMQKIYKRKNMYWSPATSFVEFGNNTKAIKSLQWFRDRAEELIEWI